LGFYASGHPLDPFRTDAELFATHTVAQLGMWTPDPIKLAVVVTAIKRQVSKRSGAEFARLTVEDFSGSSEVLVFPEAWANLSDRIRTEVPVLLEGGYSKRDQGGDSPVFIVETVTRLAELRTNGRVVVTIDLAPTSGPALSPQIMADVRAVAETYPGSAPLEVRWSDGNGMRVRFRSSSSALNASPAALNDLRALLGAERVRLVRAS
ncbi:MAG TPA: OB-fold nucleic acid binding domain-containing protein, partial [Bryobacteraceae bacterium]